MKEVLIKDRDPNIENLRLALGMVGITINYQLTELIIKVQNVTREHPENFSISNATVLRKSWSDKWEKYFKDNDKSNLMISDLAMQCQGKLRSSIKEYISYYGDNNINSISKVKFLKLKWIGEGTWEKLCEERDKLLKIDNDGKE